MSQKLGLAGGCAMKGLGMLRATRPERTLARIDLDDAVIDLEASQGGHHMFDHFDAGRALPNGRPALGWNDVIEPRGNGRSIG